MGKSISPQHEAALGWAAQGFPVFPWRLVNGEKIPCVKAWEEAATCDAALITKWWEAWPDAGVGSPPDRSGHVVLDIDDKKGKSGSDALAALEAEHGAVPATMEVMTGSGGRHLWFKGEGRNTASKLGVGLDTRGKGGWVAMPDGVRYLLLSEGPAAPCPEWITSAIRSAKHEKRKRLNDAPLDQTADVARARRHLEDLVARGDVAIEGAGGNNRTFVLAQTLLDLGCTKETALALAEEHWNPHCSPPWAHDELARIFENAAAYRQNDEGVKGGVGDSSNFAAISTNAHIEHKSSRSRFTPLDEDEQRDLPEPAWLVPGWLQHASVAMLYGEPGSYKSFAALDAALSIAAGVPAWGGEYEACAFPVVYVAAEGAIGIAKKRRPAWREHKRIDARLPFYLVQDTPLIRDAGSVNEFMRAIEDKCGAELPRLIVLDTYSRAMAGLDENAAQDASRAVEIASGLSNRYSCTVLIIHHAAKDSERERGSTALRAGVDTVIQCDADKGRKTVRLRCSKQKDAEEPKALAFRIVPAAESVVLAPMSVEDFNPGTGRSDDQMRLDCAEVLKQMGAVGVSHAVTSKALAESLLAFWGQTDSDPAAQLDAVRGVERRLNSLMKRPEYRGLICLERKPAAWALPLIPVA